jgi:hypothetical protein
LYTDAGSRSIYQRIGISYWFVGHIAEIGEIQLMTQPLITLSISRTEARTALGLSGMNSASLISFAGGLGLAVVAIMGLGMGLAYLLAEFG